MSGSPYFTVPKVLLSLQNAESARVVSRGRVEGRSRCEREKRCSEGNSPLVDYILDCRPRGMEVWTEVELPERRGPGVWCWLAPPLTLSRSSLSYILHRTRSTLLYSATPSATVQPLLPEELSLRRILPTRDASPARASVSCGLSGQ